MSKIRLILRREYLTRVRKKSFVVMTILGPILFAALVIAPAWIASLGDTDVKKIAVIDNSGFFENNIPETETIKFDYLENTSLDEIKRNFTQTDYYAVLFISELVSHTPSSVVLYSNNKPSFSVKNHISNSIEKDIEKEKLSAAGIDPDVLKSVKTSINIRTVEWTKSGEDKESSTELAMIVGYIGGFLIYFFIFLFGAQVMRGVIEEKTSRIMEILVSSVKPFQMMMGKIIGIGLVGLTQFGLWVILTLVLINGAQSVFFPELGTQSANQVAMQDVMKETNKDPNAIYLNQDQEGGSAEDTESEKFEEIFGALKDVNIGLMLGIFVFYFLGGYLLYGSLFAAVGSAVDNETDTQQFMLPITIPLILAIIVMINAINSPQGDVAFWFSIIPFTSPILMMVRIPFGVPYWEVALSMILLILTFIGTTWLSGKIYRTGILMYGKKINYKEIWKWIRYKT
ncbi:MAG: ABC transporter permease [Bacteroidales bacterium]